MQKNFGYELEFKGAILENLAQKYSIPLYKLQDVVPYDRYHLKNEIFVSELCDNVFNREADLTKGGELISPILNDYGKCLRELKFFLEILKKEGAYINPNSLNTGFHIHLDRSFLSGWDSFEKLLKFLYAFQPEIYDYSKGNHESIRKNIFEDAKPLTPSLVEFLVETGKIEFLSFKGNCILLDQKTFELRYFNSSLDINTLDSYFKFAFNLRDYIASEESDMELLNFYFQKALRDEKNLTLNRKRYKVMKNILNI